MYVIININKHSRFSMECCKIKLHWKIARGVNCTVNQWELILSNCMSVLLWSHCCFHLSFLFILSLVKTTTTVTSCLFCFQSQGVSICPAWLSESFCGSCCGNVDKQQSCLCACFVPLAEMCDCATPSKKSCLDSVCPSKQVIKISI